MKHSKKVEDYLKEVENYLTKKYTKVNPEWIAIIQLLGDNLELYAQCQKSIKENGIYNVENGKKNPLLTTVKDLQATILKQIQHLGLSPYAESKIKIAEDDDTDDFIDNLTYGQV